MSFLGGPEIMQKSQGAYPGFMMDLYGQMMKKSKGEKAANNWLGQIMHGQAGNVSFLDPFKNKEAVALREADRSSPSMALANSPELARRTQELNKDRIRETYGGLQGQAIDQAVQGLTSTSIGAKSGRMGMGMDLLDRLRRGELDSQQVVDKPGWGQFAMNAAFGGAKAAGGLGWSPFG